MPRRKKSRRRDHPSTPKKDSKTANRVTLIAALLILFSGGAIYTMVRRPQTADLRIGDCRIRVTIADTDQLRKKGLSGQRYLKKGHGMLFVFQRQDRQHFWMKDTQIPLSIAFISHEGTILQIEQMAPFDLQRVTSQSPVQYALEVNQGFFEKNGIEVGMKVDLENIFEQ